MAKFRQVHTEFWQDAFVLELTPEEKYFYLYLMTNSKTSQCGIYELPKRIIEIETGYNRETVDKLLQRFIDYGKIKYNEETQEIMLINWLKYNATKSPKVISCIKQELLKVKTAEFRQYALNKLSELGFADKKLYRMANKTEIPATLAKKIFERDKKCVRCGSTEDLTIDHIFPRSVGGTNRESNLRVLCRSCNSKRPTSGQALIDDLASEGLSFNDFARLCFGDTVSNKNDTVSIDLGEEKEEEEEKEKEEEQQEEEKDTVSEVGVKALRFYEKNYGFLNGFITENIITWCEDLSDDLVIYAMQIALKNQKPFSYAEGILRNWLTQNVKTLDDAKALERKFKSQKQENIQGRDVPRDSEIDFSAGEDENWSLKNPF